MQATTVRLDEEKLAELQQAARRLSFEQTRPITVSDIIRSMVDRFLAGHRAIRPEGACPPGSRPTQS